MTTDVSTIPRGGRGSATRSRSLIEQRVDVVAEPLGVDEWGAGELSDRALRRYELPLPKRRQLSHWNAVARNDERLAAIELAHDLAALVSELALGDLSCHTNTVAHVLRRRAQDSGPIWTFIAWPEPASASASAKPSIGKWCDTSGSTSTAPPSINAIASWNVYRSENDP